MPEFPHLSLPTRVGGQYNSPYGRGKRPVVVEKSQTTLDNLNNRTQHGNRIRRNAETVIENWSNMLSERPVDSPRLPDSIPLFLHVDPKVFSSDELSSFGIDVVSEKEDGFIIGASHDLELGKLKEKITKFIENRTKSGKPSQLWEINEGTQWRVDEILSPRLFQRWNSIQDAEILTVEISVACFVKVGEYPSKGTKTEEQFNQAILNWERRKRDADIVRGELELQRESDVQGFLDVYAGELLDSIDFNDSWTYLITISGKGLKDLVYNYPYLFEVTLPEDLEALDSQDLMDENVFDVQILKPDANAPKVCIIDSGVQSSHPLLENAIDEANSRSYLPDNNVTADQVPSGGHGTRVAGVALYFNNIQRTGDFKPILTIQNARILDESNSLPDNLSVPVLMGEIVTDYSVTGTRIYNLSVNERIPCATIHMSTWAAKIDQLILDHDILFVISAGNIHSQTISQFIESGTEYPDYLFQDISRIANPAQSSFGITVGSICEGQYQDRDRRSFGSEGEISAFSRSGLGMWGSIKPDVVEYGGDFVRERQGQVVLITNRPECCPELVCSTFDGNASLANRDMVGTSFSAPRVSHIIAAIQSNLPDYSTLLYKTLLIQSARWPEVYQSHTNPLNVIKHIGFGVPDLGRATSNSDYRITLVYEGNISPKKADVFNIKIPQEIRRVGDEYDILVEITVSFRARPRRTRRYSYSYLSSYLQWESSQFGESFDMFRNRVIQSTESDIELEEADQVGLGSFPWTIQTRRNSGIHDIKLNDSSTQKDWAIIKSHQLTNDFGIGVIGRNGWEKDLNTEIPYAIAVSFESVNRDIEIYDRIRVENQIEIEQEIRV
ncbi:MAG: S8 family serine peptidase [Imperialibacter sp.]|uniref:S8 family serine peptidase n=1 Tax=Imperialibacter sp. TaxID=2038411 RepID=UPI0032EE6A7A